MLELDREIKFRGKDKANVWLFGTYCQDEECIITLVNDTYVFIKKWDKVKND